MCQFEEFLSPKCGPSGRHHIEGVLGDEVGPVRRQRAQTASAVMEPGPVLTPVLATLDQIKFLAEQWMVRVGYAKRSTLNATMRRS